MSLRITLWKEVIRRFRFKICDEKEDAKENSTIIHCDYIACNGGSKYKNHDKNGRNGHRIYAG